MSAPMFRARDIVRYDSERRTRHCREGTAVVLVDGRMKDTFWGIPGYGDDHFLTAAEIATAELQFNLDDYEQVRGEETWERYAEADRALWTAQHGCTKHYMVRLGAVEDIATQVANARRGLASAKDTERSAGRWVESCQRELDRLLAVLLEVANT